MAGIFRRRKHVNNDVEFTVDEINTALALVATLNPSKYVNAEAKAVILKVQAVAESGRDIWVRT